jgi:hypothetical protein
MSCRHRRNVFASKVWLLVIVGLCLTASVPGRAQQEQPPDGGGIAPPRAEAPDLTDAERARIHEEIRQNVQAIRASKLAPVAPQGGAVSFAWPLRLAAGSSDPGYHGVSGFVDHDARYPNYLLDYACGTRTYDLASGYNHKGTDYFLWPFDWNKMDASEVEVVAAAGGVIVGKSDGNYDRSCSMSGGQWNAVYIQHDDGSTAWYGHMKAGSVTSKGIGASVGVGEYLGVVGSSGNSTGPHLHLEVYDAASQLVDPYQGACNVTPSLWAAQRPYADSAINKLATHFSPPNFSNPCPNPDTPNLRDAYAPGETVYFASYFRDQRIGQVTTYAIFAPNGSLYSTWSNTFNADYNASYWYWTITLPASAALGTWRFEATFLGVTYQHLFRVARTNDFNSDGKSDLLWQHQTAGDVYAWFMNGTTISNGSYVARGMDSNWRVVGVADLNADGKPDLLWQNGATGDVYAWYMNGTTFTAGSYVARGVDLNWKIVAAADLNGDRKADLVWQDAATGDVYVWFMNGVSVTAGAYITRGMDLNWKIVGTADVNSDGRPDLVWQHQTTGGVYVWYLNGLMVTGGTWLTTAMPADWKVVGTVDLTGDGKPDILWYHVTSGDVYLWTMDGTVVAGGSYIRRGLDLNWRFAGPK